MSARTPAAISSGRGAWAGSTLKYHPRKEQVIEKVLAPLHEAANAIAI